MNNTQITLYNSFRNDERNTALIYREVAKRTTDKDIQVTFAMMAETEEKHAARWEELIVENGAVLKKFTPSGKTHLLLFFLRFLGVKHILPILISAENKGAGNYKTITEAKGMQEQEDAHALLMQNLNDNFEQKHRTPGGNSIRAAVMGASDGLLSNLNLTMGIAGAAVSNKYILLTGLAGLLAGAISMAIGEWISVKSSEELYQHQYETELAEMEYAPENELEELVTIFKARGHSEVQAKALAEGLMKDKHKAVEMLVMNEVGSDVVVEEGSAWTAALTSFFLFIAGAIIPVIPYFFLEGLQAVLLSAGLSVIGLFILGSTISLFTGKGVLYSGVRQIIIGLLAGGVTYIVGHFIGVHIS